MSTGKIELSVGAVKYVDPNEIITEEEYNYIKNKVPELDERVGVIEGDIEEINSSLDKIVQKDSNIVNNNKYKILTDNITSDNILDLTNILLKGNGKIDYSNKNNFLKKISNNEGIIIRKINSYNNFCDFKYFKKAVYSERPINIVFWGDSLSTSNGDILNCNIDNFSGSELSPNGLTNYDTYFSLVIDLLIKNFPNKTFNFYNRAIGGEIINNWTVEKTFNQTSKMWVNHVKDLNPDLIFIGFGMNQNLTNAKNFSFFLKNIFEYMQNTDYVVVTTPRPSLVKDESWGGLETQLAKEITADSIRQYALDKNKYILDVNKLSNLKRIGTDFLNPTFIDKKTQIIENNGGVNQKGISWFNVLCKDFVLEFDCNIGSGNTILIRYNCISDYDNRIIINENSVSLYSNFADYINWGLNAKTYNGSTNGKISIKKRNGFVRIYLNGQCILTDRSYVGSPFGYITLENQGGNGINNITNIKLFEDEYQIYTPSITETEMYGEFIEDDYNTKSKYGGNGVNHPSTIGLNECYLPCLEEFIDDINSILNNGINDFIMNKTISFSKVDTSLNPNNDLYFSLVSNNILNIYIEGYTKNNLIDWQSAKTYLNNNEFTINKFDNNNKIIVVRKDTEINVLDVIEKII